MRQIKLNFLSLFLNFLIFNYGILFSDIIQVQSPKLTTDACVLPEDHPLQEKLKNLFEIESRKIFNSPEHLRHAGFEVLDRVHRYLMVISHPSVPQYLFKKFQNHVSQQEQLENYLRRINGARALHQFIEWNHLQHIVVPQKWLFLLPPHFSDPLTRESSYLLIVEKMDICSGGKDPNGEMAKKYYHIDKNILRELCTVLYYFRGLDSMLHNVPFTHQNKIAFIDTERWERKRTRYLQNIKPYLSKSRQYYVRSVLKELESER